MPTDAEWEFAARGGLEDASYGELDDIAWHYDNSGNSLKPVGKKKPNAYGLHDMLGNVWEYVWDAETFKPYPADVTDPIIGETLEFPGQDRVCRGGSYGERAYNIRATVRFQMPASSGGDQYGFRPVRTVK
ncbi:MAG: formylglycine-generating enzyme family protein [Archangium sp.]